MKLKPSDRRSVLVVDNDPQMARILCEVVRQTGCHAVPAESAAAALARLAVMEVDLVISDQWLHGMDGLSMLELMARRCPRLPSILVTANPNLETRVRAATQRITHYLVKPFRPEVLRDAILEALAGPDHAPGAHRGDAAVDQAR